MSQKPRGPGAHHDDRRREIADAVLAIVADRGIAAVSLNETAAQAGVSAGRVQHYYPTKAELITAAYERANSLSAARIRKLVGTDDLVTADPRRVLNAVLTELIPYSAETLLHLRVRQFFHAQALADPKLADDLRQRYEHFHAQIRDLITRISPGLTSAADALAVKLAALAEGLAYYVLIGVCSPDKARTRLTVELDELTTTGGTRAVSADGAA